MSIGVNITPGWGDTACGSDLGKMASCLLALKAGTVRLPWVNNASTLATLSWCAQQHIDVVVTDVYGQPEDLVNGIATAGFPVAALEGVNEPDNNNGQPAPISDYMLAYATDRQTRLYKAAAGRWPVLSPSAAWRENESALLTLPHDVANVHRYSSAAPTVADAQLPVTDKPVWVTETGWSTWKKIFLLWTLWVISPQQQADWFTSMIGMLKANGAQRVIAYTLLDEGSGVLASLDASKNWGVFRYDGTSKIAASILSTVA